MQLPRSGAVWSLQQSALQRIHGIAERIELRKVGVNHIEELQADLLLFGLTVIAAADQIDNDKKKNVELLHLMPLPEVDDVLEHQRVNPEVLRQLFERPDLT